MRVVRVRGRVSEGTSASGPMCGRARSCGPSLHSAVARARGSAKRPSWMLRSHSPGQGDRVRVTGSG